MGWRDWSGWERPDRLDQKAGLRKDRSPEEEAESTRRGLLVLYCIMVAVAIFLAVMGRWWNALTLVGLIGLHRWLRRPMKL